MTVNEAERIHEAVLSEMRRRSPLLVPPSWTKPVRIEPAAEDSWVFWYVDPIGRSDDRREAVVVRGDGKGAFVVFGAIGKVFFSPHHQELLGLPRSSERWLGSGPGRYQLFDRGMVVWDGVRDVGYARRMGEPTYMAGRRCFAVVGFCDLRGFTRWSERVSAGEVQEVLESLEAACQSGFTEEWCRQRQIFIKGTGDGLMVVSDESFAGGLDDQGDCERSRTQHVYHFLHAWCRFAREARTNLPSELALGSGLECGMVDQVLILGQWDYIGEPLNNAAKLQQLAWDEVCTSVEYQRLLGIGHTNLAQQARPLGDRGFRFSIDVL